MADFQAETPDAPPSTVLDTEAAPSASGGGTPNLIEPADDKADKPASLRDDIEAAFKEDAAEEKAEKPTEPAKDEKAEPKPEDKPAEDGKPKDEQETDEKAEKPAEEARPDKAEKPNGHIGPPRNFLPDAQEAWRNVPNAVRREVDRTIREHEAEVTQLREAGQRYEALKPFDEMARQNGRDLRESLSRVVELENLFQTNPIAGLQAMLNEAGPRKADGQSISLWELANFVVSQGQEGYQKLVAQQRQPANDRGASEADNLRAELEALKAQVTLQPMIERFASRNPRFHELQNDVAFFLKSDKIPASLSPEDRLAAAYDMAVRINPASTVARDRHSEDGPAQDERRAGPDFSGSKSIKQSPGSVAEEVEDQAPRGETTRESIRKALRSVGA